MTTTNVLISLHRGYGMGDAVQMSAVLRHVAKYRPEWTVGFQAETGRHCVGRGIAAEHFEFGCRPDPDKQYDAEVEILLYDVWHGFCDRPNTHVSACLRDRFGLDWDRECGRYRVDVSPEAEARAREMMRGMWEFGRRHRNRHPRFVAVHYKGDSAPDRKNLSDEQADAVCDAVVDLGCVPLLIDWRDTSPLGRRHDARTVGRFHYSRAWGREAEMNCAVIARCAAFVGIDSGPAKCASATQTPSLVVWTGHHPARFHDPAPNTTHLVPRGYHATPPVCGDVRVAAWFEANYDVRQYVGDPVGEVRAWLMEVLK